MDQIAGNGVISVELLYLVFNCMPGERYRKATRVFITVFA